jgi:hypothetical protein
LSRLALPFARARGIRSIRGRHTGEMEVGVEPASLGLSRVRACVQRTRPRPLVVALDSYALGKSCCSERP